MEKLNLNFLRAARRKKKLSLREVAERIGKERSTVYRYENGEIAITTDVLSKMLAVYGVSITDVYIKGEDDGDEKDI